MAAEVSVIVRAKDKADTIGATLEALRRQTVPVEIIVVDSGSTDGTLALAERRADRVIELPPGSFSYGGALNIGAEVATARVHAALSAHCVPFTDTWLADSLRLYETQGVGATNAARHTPTGEEVVGAYFQSLDDVRVNPGWGFSNHASTWLAEVWQRFPFREDLVACEDKEWSWRVLGAGWTIAYAPELLVPSDHRRKAGLVALSQRVARETEAMISLGAAAPLSTPDVARVWWNSFRADRRHPRMLLRASPYRLAELAGAWRGSRHARWDADAELRAIEGVIGEPFQPWRYVPWT